MAKGFFKKHKNNKLNLFLFFLLVAGIFWVLTKFSREFTTSMEAKINYQNIPETAALAKDNPHQLSFDLTANGFEILFYKFKKPSLNIEVADFYNKDKEGFTLSRNEVLKLISNSFNRYLEVKNLSVDQLNVHLDRIVLKKVKVRPKTDIEFKTGYKALDSIVLVPDSVTISGPESSLKQIKFVETKTLSLKNIDKNISEIVSIASPTDEVVAIKPSEVSLQWAVAEFSQGKYNLPVEVINLPPGMELKLVPQMVSVSFDMALQDFAAVSMENFRVVCDYSQRNKEENFMLPKLIKKPEGAVNIVIEPKKIDFFIFK